MEINIKQILGDTYMSRFKVFNMDTLFEPEWSNLQINRCPLCGNKLKFLRNGKLALCSGRLHKKSFCISIKRLSLIKEKYGKIA